MKESKYFSELLHRNNQPKKELLVRGVFRGEGKGGEGGLRRRRSAGLRELNIMAC